MQCVQILNNYFIINLIYYYIINKMNLNYLVAEPPIIEASRQGNLNKLKKY